MAELSPDLNLSHYRIVSKIGAGGMGEVYLAQDTSELGRTVALKVLPAEIAKDRDRLQRFTQEARTVSNLNHPNILTVHEFGETDFASFIATEYVDGVTLREHLSKRRLKLIDVLDVAIQIVAALNAAHEAGVTHRDLKPENVMVRKDHIVKVLDFGLAKLSEPAAVASGVNSSESQEAATKVLVKTEPGLVMGTVSYMSPEQSAGTAVDQRTDIWSVGVVLYEMIAGSVPFPGKDIHRQIIAIQEAVPVPLAQQVPNVPERLEEIIGKCLAKDKNERYQTAKDLLIDLRNLRRKLDVDAEIERTVTPAQRSTSGGASPSTQGAQMNGGASPSAAQARTTSSAEYIVTRIRQHKLAAVIVALVLVAGIIGLGLYWRARNSNTVATINSIAVLPLVNESGNADVEYLSDGITESLINSLSQLPSLSVKARSTVFRYKGRDITPQQVGSEMSVQAVLNGRVVQRGDQLTLSLELVNARSGDQIWGEQYTRSVSDLLSVQAEIANDISRRLHAEISREDRQKLTKGSTTNPEAYQLYLKGNYFAARYTKDGSQKGIQYFNQAIAADPSYALAYNGLAYYYIVANEWYLAPRDAMPKAREAAKKALAIDETLAAAHASLAVVTDWHDWDWVSAEREYKRAIELDPNDPRSHQFYSWFLAEHGRVEEAIAEAKRAQQLDPISPEQGIYLGQVLLFVRHYDEAADVLQKTVELDETFWLSHDFLGRAYEQKGRLPEAIAEFQRAIQLEPAAAENRSMLGHAYAVSGNKVQALKIIDELKELSKSVYVPPYNIAIVYAGLGDKEQAFAWLERAFEERSGYLTWFTTDPQLDNLRSDPRFADLLRRVGLQH